MPTRVAGSADAGPATRSLAPGDEREPLGRASAQDVDNVTPQLGR